MPDVLNGYEPAARFPERRALFDLKRRVAILTSTHGQLDIKGTYSGTSTPLPTAEVGDMWVVGTPVPTAAPPSPSGGAATAGDVIIYNGTSWVNIGHATGPVGPAGPLGPQGPTGPAGPSGPSVSDGDKGDVTVSSSSTVWTIDANAVTLAKLADIASQRLIGRSSPGSGDPEALTGTQVTALLDLFSTAFKGLVPPSPGGTDMFLRADGVWAVPPGGSGTPVAGDVDGGTAGSTYTTIIDGGTAAATGPTVIDGGTAGFITYDGGSAGVTGGTLLDGGDSTTTGSPITGGSA